uniref:Uncharacterized protein n=1 Tax=Pipistrellus kuhlii TaxID=59472 RepID=A0A7J8B1Y9_PIPKU|nr:hypothetical protein mPipKuh1_007689 [Pipistrellus kuhlii]
MTNCASVNIFEHISWAGIYVGKTSRDGIATSCFGRRFMELPSLEDTPVYIHIHERAPVPQHRAIQPLPTDRLKMGLIVLSLWFPLIASDTECLYLSFRALAYSVLGTAFSAHSPLRCLLWSLGRIQPRLGCLTEGSAPCWLAAGATGSSLPPRPLQVQRREPIESTSKRK